MAILEQTSTGTASRTHWFDADGNEEFPCHCGEVHRGDYALYDFGHHVCLHRGGLFVLNPEDAPDQLICGSCGQTFWLRLPNGGREGDK